MLRRSIRFGLRLGLLAGVAFAIFKLMQSRRPTEAPLPETTRDPWPPVPAPPPSPPAVAKKVSPPARKPEPVKKAPAKAAKAAKKATKATKKTAKKVTGVAWVEPQGGVCPLSHPIKAKLASKIFHMPGMLNYTRTRPDRCYGTEAAATSDGFSPAKR